MFDTLYNHIRVKYFGMANVKLSALVIKTNQLML